MKTTTRQRTFSQLLRHMAPKSIIAAFALMLLSFVPHTPAHATQQVENWGLCPVDRPCISELYQQGDTIHIAWNPNGDYDGYNIHWSRPGREGGFHVDGTSATFRTPNHHMTYTFSVEGCTTHFLAPSTCSPWSFSEQIMTT